MDKSTKEITDIVCELMSFWKKGWPDYYENNVDDHPAIMLIAEKCYTHFKVRLWHRDGYERVCQAVQNIAFYCRNNDPWASKNLRYINLGFQRLFNEMSAKQRIAKLRIAENYYNYKK